ncbi:contractile injection system protein, VgrG/Pvc8 family [Acinetobacter sp. MD2(2019)]|uniref:contractile injection system protein, VgrG/Pvc8 family n=1 Tax=Acinetobacter sp. MD2(2019) TaxID=2605273 RepID=UPI002D1F2838|nr:contractile injection system protein, VgrG/Pvc8 family [Acinetobacter sp. MD2(2019)]MEB3754704.1 DNA primase [Acinetobacter sp. MD2(2019)]
MSVLQNIQSVIHRILDSVPVPIYRIVVNGQDISSKLNNRLIRLTITDHRGLEADTITLEISDHDGMVNIPPKDAVIQVWIGWQSSGMVYKGKYSVKETEHSGAPDVVSIRATSADLKKNLKKKKERSFDQKTIEQIITTIAYEHELIPSVHADLAFISLAHIDQNESDANLITRIADEHDAIATVKNGILLFMPKGNAQTATGNELPMAVIKREDGDSHRYSMTDGGDDLSGVKAYYYNEKSAKKESVTVGDTDEYTKDMRHIFRDKETAIHAAQAEYNRVKRKSATFSISLAQGMPELIPEMTLSFVGFKSEINNVIWLGTSIQHQIDASSGFTTQIDAEIQLPDSDDIAQLIDEEGGTYSGVLAYYKNGTTTQKVSAGDTKSPKRLTYLYKNKATATTAVNREWKELQNQKEG